MKEIILQSAVGPEVTIDGKRFLLFGGTDYLGMAGRPEVVKGAVKAAEKYGVSSSSSRISIGSNELHLQLEKAVSHFAGTEDAVVMATGFMAMNALLAGVLRKEDSLIIQNNAHPSIREAVTVREPECLEFRIDDLNTLQDVLRKIPGKNRVVVVGEGVSPLFGTVFPLPEVQKLLSNRQALVLLDDAHAFGVLGAGGKGTAEFYNCKDKNVHACTTLSKAFGSFGGCVPGSRTLTGAIRANSLAYQSSTPPPAPVTGAALAAMAYLEEHPELLQKLRENARFLKQGLFRIGLAAENPDVPIAPICLAEKERLTCLSDRLLEEGIMAPLSDYPGSPDGGMIRIAVSAVHSREQIDFLLECISRHL